MAFWTDKNSSERNNNMIRFIALFTIGLIWLLRRKVHLGNKGEKIKFRHVMYILLEGPLLQVVQGDDSKVNICLPLGIFHTRKKFRRKHK